MSKKLFAFIFSCLLILIIAIFVPVEVAQSAIGGVSSMTMLYVGGQSAVDTWGKSSK